MSVKKLAITAASVGLVASALTLPNAAQADRSGAVAAGIAGGIIGGAIIGSAIAPRPCYEPAPVYAVPPPQEPMLLGSWRTGLGRMAEGLGSAAYEGL